jgi:type IV pilus assembly protein PilM
MKSLKDIFASLASSGSSNVVGIDIGSSSIKVVEIKEDKEVLTLVTYGELQLGPYAGRGIGESVILTPKQEQEALVDVLRESAVTAKKAVFAMPLSSSFVTNVSIEAEPKADLTPLVRIEARKVIPASLTEITLDWAEVEKKKDPSLDKKQKAAESTRRDVLIAAIQNSALERFKVLMQYANMQEPPTEIECFSTIRSIYETASSDTVIIDIGSVSSKLYIVKNGLLMRMHRIRAGGTIATENISQSLKLAFEDAELKKQNASDKDTDFAAMQRAHHSSYERAFREFNQVIREYEQKQGAITSPVYVCGGGAMFPGIDSLLHEVTSREVVRAHPFRKVAYPAFMQDTLKEIGPTFTASLGAALRYFE